MTNPAIAKFFCPDPENLEHLDSGLLKHNILKYALINDPLIRRVAEELKARVQRYKPRFVNATYELKHIEGLIELCNMIEHKDIAPLTKAYVETFDANKDEYQFDIIYRLRYSVLKRGLEAIESNLLIV